MIDPDALLELTSLKSDYDRARRESLDLLFVRGQTHYHSVERRIEMFFTNSREATMLVIKIELWPRGERAKAREIGRTYIANVGGGMERGDYQAAVCKRASEKQISTDLEWYHRTPTPLDPSGPKPTRLGSVTSYPRQSYNVWRLVIRALLDCFPEERR